MTGTKKKLNFWKNGIVPPGELLLLLPGHYHYWWLLEGRSAGLQSGVSSLGFFELQ